MKKRITTSIYNGETVSTRVNYLPWETIFEILLRLPVESLIQCKLVCKNWYAIIKDPQFIDLHLTKSTCRHYILFELNEYTKHTPSIYSLVQEEDNKLRAITIIDNNLFAVGLTHNFSGSFFVSGSCNGLLCISPDGEFLDPIFICNLFTQECVKLPVTTEPLTVIHPYVQKEIVLSKTDPPVDVVGQLIGFGYDPLTKRYKLVRVFQICPYEEDIDPYGEIMTMGDSAWRTLKFPHPILMSTQSETLFFEGSFYWFINHLDGRPRLHDILAFDIGDEKFSTLKFPPYMEIDMESSYPILMNHKAEMGSDDDVIAELQKSPEPNPNLVDHIPEITVQNNPPLIREYPPFREIRLVLPPHCHNDLDIPPQLLHVENYSVPNGYFELIDRSELSHFPWYVNQDVPPIPDSIFPYHPIFLQEKIFTKADKDRLSLDFSTIRVAIPRFFTPTETEIIYQARSGANGLQINFWVITPNNEVSVGNARLRFNSQNTCVMTKDWFHSRENDTKAYLDGLLPKTAVGLVMGKLCLKSKKKDSMGKIE
ncbi:hypothetical protein FRX31_014892 [Thalictrum thalictroides]|uniref:F-box domain-containing protein n=1 Tax=Thalictrum thalictroides TaxID=46969 RepID=A0A7J6WGI9_THATH|nr:hypothetical protein FRX31_014892 [Thalictrum thalictroides]